MAHFDVVSSPVVHAPIGLYSAGFSIEIHAGDRLVVIAGQVALDRDGAVVGVDDFAAQFAQVYRNLGELLAAAGATPDDIVSLRTYLTDENDIGEFFTLRNELYPTFFETSNHPPNTLLVVRSLVRPEFKIEVEALASVRPQ